MLKFRRDRKRWLHWLFEARKRYRLTVLNYSVTCNHIHLLVLDERAGAVSKSVQLAAGRTAQEYNLRKDRKGAFWEDRYHATAIDTGEYLARCLAYIDTNMVRAGAVTHPEQWETGGYRELQNQPKRYRLIDIERLMQLLNIGSYGEFQKLHRRWIREALNEGEDGADLKRYSDGIAFGSREFVEYVIKKLGIAPKRRKKRPDILQHHDAYWV